MGTALGAAALLLFSCGIAVGLLVTHLLLSLVNGSQRDFQRLAVAWWVVSGVIFMLGLVLVELSSHVKGVALLLTIGVPMLSSAMGALAARRARGITLAPPRSARLLPIAIGVALSLTIGCYVLYSMERSRAIDATLEP